MKILLSTNYYNLTIPVSWEGKYEYYVNESTGYGYFLDVYHVSSRQEESGGWLFTIGLVPQSDGVPEYPSAKYLGELTAYRINSFYVYAIFPTDVQFSTSTAEEYQAMYEDIDDILNTIHQCGEAVFTRAIETEPVIPQEEFESYTLHIDNPELFIYDAPGYDANIVGKITDQKSYTIVEEYVEEEDDYITYTWGKLKSGAGWINLYDAISY